MIQFEKIQGIFADILDIETAEISEASYIVRDLGAESIDLLELAVSLNAAFQPYLKSEIVDDDIFLIFLREYIVEADTSGKDRVDFIQGKYPFLKTGRIRQMLDDLDDGPVMKVSDLMDYLNWLSKDA